MEILSKIEEEIKELEKRINKYLWLDEWKFSQNCVNGEKIETDDSSWETKKQPIHWALKDGDAYLRKWIEIPEEIEGIRIKNSKILLKFVFPSGVTLYVNGKEVYSHKFWADKIATPYLLTEKAIPGEKILIVFKTKKGDGLGNFWASLSIENINNLLFQLQSLLYQIKFGIMITKETRNKELKRNIEKCIKIFQPEIIEKRDWNSFSEILKEEEKLLEKFRPYAKKYKVHLIGHAHIDMNWLWTYEDTISIVLRDFSTITKLMDKYRDLTFSQSQTHVYKICEENDKNLFEKVKEKVRSDNWDITANAWVENDLNMSDGESIVRHIIYSKKYIKEKFNKNSEIMWSPDTFGHPQTIPSILNHANIKYYYFMRCGKGLPLFLWEGKNKSRVIAFNSVYNNEIKPERIIPSLLEYYKKYRIKDFMFVYGVGNHGGGPTEEDIERKLKLDKQPCLPSFEFSTTHKFFKIIEKYKDKLPIVKDELNFIFEGCYTTHSDIKKGNRECEKTLFILETLMGVGSLNNIKFSEQDLEDLWQKTLFNQFHDILDGSAIHESYIFSNKIIKEVIEKSWTKIKEISEKLKNKNENCITVFNPLGWEISPFINFEWKDKEEVFLEDEKGNIIETEIIDNKLNFIACSIPPYNFKRFYIKKGKVNDGYFQKKEEEYENKFYRIWIDKGSGLIRGIYDKKNKRDVIPYANSIPEDRSSYWAENCANLIKIYWEKPHPMSAWIIGNIYKVENLIDMEEMEISENKIKIIFEIKRNYQNNKIIQRTILYRDLPYIDFEFETNWKIKGDKINGVPMVRANFNFLTNKNEFFCEIPFGVAKRKIIPREFPALRWAGFKENDYWFVIMNREKYGYYVDGKNLALTLLRNPYEPDADPDSGYHFISYRLFFGKSNITEITKMSMEYNIQPVIIEGEVKPIDLFTLKGEVIPTIFKKSIQGDGYILRFVEYEGKEKNCELKFDREIKDAWISNINEENVEKISLKNNSIAIKVKPFDIVTLKLIF